MALGDSPEFSPFNRAPLGVPGNPLDGTPMGQDTVRPKKWWENGTTSPLQPPGRMEPTGITQAGGLPSSKQLPQFPEQLLVPDVVSATDPAFSMHPVVREYLGGLARTPASDTGGSGSPWAQLRPKGVPRKSDIVGGLGMGTKGLDLPYQDQGAQLGR